MDEFILLSFYTCDMEIIVQSLLYSNNEIGHIHPALIAVALKRNNDSLDLKTKPHFLNVIFRGLILF